DLAGAHRASRIFPRPSSHWREARSIGGIGSRLKASVCAHQSVKVALQQQGVQAIAKIESVELILRWTLDPLKSDSRQAPHQGFGKEKAAKGLAPSLDLLAQDVEPHPFPSAQRLTRLEVIENDRILGAKRVDQG